MVDTSRIAKNTLFLYFRQMLIMGVGLYTVRVVLNVLGAEDYGIYNVVAGTVTMLGFLSGAMASASQRYFAYDIGKNDMEHLKTSFSVMLQIYLLLSLVIILLAETAGLWLVNRRLVIPPVRMAAANWVFQCAVLSFTLTLITAPYMASIIAHERMGVYAYVSIMEALLKLGAVLLLRALSCDKLVLYGVLLCAVSAVNTALYRAYCRRNFPECRLRPIKDRELFREMAGYGGWNLFGSGAWVIKNQGCTILLNLFMGVAVNAAQGIATSVKSAVQHFSSNFIQAAKPQIVKSYAAADYDGLWNIVFFGCKCAYFLLIVTVIPLYGNAEYVLLLWIKNIPDFTADFVRLVLIEILIQAPGEVLATVNQATGKIALYQFLVGLVTFMNLPVSYVFLRLGFSPECVYAIAIVSTLCMTMIRMLFLLRVQGFSLADMMLKVILRLILTAMILFPMAHFVSLANGTFLSFAADALLKILVSCAVILLVGFSTAEQARLLNAIRQFFRKGRRW